MNETTPIYRLDIYKVSYVYHQGNENSKGPLI